MSQLTQPFSSRNAILAFITPPLAPAPPPPPDQLIELAIVVHRQGCECLIGQACRVGASLEGKIAHVATSLAENTDHRSTAVVAPLENRRGQGHEPPEQIEGFRRIPVASNCRRFEASRRRYRGPFGVSRGPVGTAACRSLARARLSTRNQACATA